MHGRVQKLIALKEGRSDETMVKGTLAPFRLQAPKELIEVGYECGFGEKKKKKKKKLPGVRYGEG